MNPLVWRFMGGVTVATAVDLVIPGYSRILFAGLGAALPEGSKKAGVRRGVQKGLETIGKAEWKILMSPQNLGRFGYRTIPKVGFKIIPVIGWAWLAYDVGKFYQSHPAHAAWMWEQYDPSSVTIGGATPSMPNLPI